MGGFVGQIVPLVRVFGHLIEFFAAFTIVDVMKTLRANGMIGANPVGGMGDHCRIRPRSFRVTYQGGNTASFVIWISRQSTKIEKSRVEVQQTDRACTGFRLQISSQFFGHVDDEWCARGLFPEGRLGKFLFTHVIAVVSPTRRRWCCLCADSLPRHRARGPHRRRQRNRRPDRLAPLPSICRSHGCA